MDIRRGRGRTVLVVSSTAVLLIALAAGTAVALRSRSVPDVTGLPVAEARSRLQRAGFWLHKIERGDPQRTFEGSFLPSGTVLDQDPPPEGEGSIVASVKLFVAQDPIGRSLKVPSVIGCYSDDAEALLRRDGFKVLRSAEPTDPLAADLFADGDPKTPVAFVSSQTPAPGELATYGVTVRLKTTAIHAGMAARLGNSREWVSGHGLLVLRNGAGLCANCHVTSDSCAECHPHTAFSSLVGRARRAPTERPSTLSLGPETAALVAALKKRGTNAYAEMGESPIGVFFEVPEAELTIEYAGYVMVYEFPDESSAKKAARNVQPDGTIKAPMGWSSMGTTEEPYPAPPHLFRKGRLIAIYLASKADRRTGLDKKVLASLSAAMGPQFAGAK